MYENSKKSVEPTVMVHRILDHLHVASTTQLHSVWQNRGFKQCNPKSRDLTPWTVKKVSGLQFSTKNSSSECFIILLLRRILIFRPFYCFRNKLYFLTNLFYAVPPYFTIKFSGQSYCEYFQPLFFLFKYSYKRTIWESSTQCIPFKQNYANWWFRLC